MKKSFIKHIVVNMCLAFSLVTFSITSCKKSNTLVEDTLVQTPITANEEIEKLTAFLSTSVNTKISNVVYNPIIDEFLIDGDISMPLREAKINYESYKSRDIDGGRQGIWQYQVNRSILPNIKVFVKSYVSTDWKVAVNEAIALWNNTADCLAKFQRVTSTSGISTNNLIVLDTSSIARIFAPNPIGVASARLPRRIRNSSGSLINAVGDSMFINKSNPNNYAANIKKWVMFHELGHCIGFRHTDSNEQGTNQIPGTPAYGFGVLNPDPGSVMNSNTANSQIYDPNYASFSAYDFIAFGVIYPNEVGTKRLLRYYNPQISDHFYSIDNTTHATLIGIGYVPEKGAGYAYTSQQPSTVPIYRFYNQSFTDHFYSTDPNDLNDAPSVGYVYEGIEGYIHSTQVAGSKPLYRYFSPSLLNHFYTTTFNELGGDYAYEGIIGYVR
jgi:hypothetical protein